MVPRDDVLHVGRHARMVGFSKMAVRPAVVGGLASAAVGLSHGIDGRRNGGQWEKW